MSSPPLAAQSRGFHRSSFLQKPVVRENVRGHQLSHFKCLPSQSLVLEGRAQSLGKCAEVGPGAWGGQGLPGSLRPFSDASIPMCLLLLILEGSPRSFSSVPDASLVKTKAISWL